jgi:hypothetical protein
MSALAQAANETATVDSSATAHSGATTQYTSTPASPTSSLLPASARRIADTETTSPYQTINYITHTLPQQCAKKSWSAPGEVAAPNSTGAEGGVISGIQTSVPETREGPQSAATEEASSATPAVASQTEPTSQTSSASSDTASVEPESELETDSPFDNANFLSFEEWKKKNLAEVGQSPENVGQGRAAASNQPARRRPVNVNALDSLGDEGEISIDFSGFGTSEDEKVPNSIQPGHQNTGNTKRTGGDGKVAPSSWALSKDAGKTCKERFNYASFDCAATVLKTNKQAKSSSSILVENKDSYMLNECSADNKFLIVELCDDILVDTIVLANYEFFSSMFRHFRVSVSDRYPVKMEKWRTLGTFEARNSRDVQPFLIAEPQIWARYLRVEFLTQFGNEYYCPLSVLRVHGTTMMEQFRREEEEARGIEDDDGDLDAEGVDVKRPTESSGPLPPDEIPIEAMKNDGARPDDPAEVDNAIKQAASPEPLFQSARIVPSTITGPSTVTTEMSAGQWTDSPQTQDASNVSSVSSSSSVILSSKDSGVDTTSVDRSSSLSAPSTTEKARVSSQSHSSANASVITPSPDTSRNNSTASSAVSSTASASSSSTLAKALSNGTVSYPQAQTRGSPTQPSGPAPSTQESFFKSIHKRLLYLEANSTLSLQYIEEQSRALRDAFVKVEKRQLAKTEKFLDHLNSTVLLEVKSFRNMYDQLWQSTVIELESMKGRQKSEMEEIGTRLSLMADELVWQKRMAVVQSTLLLLCLGLVLFVRSGTLGAAQDVPIVQKLGSKYTSFFESSPPRSLPDTSSGTARRRKTFKNMRKSDTSVGLSDHQSNGRHTSSDAETDGLRSPIEIRYSPPTPNTPNTPDTRNSTPSARVNGSDKENSPPIPSSEDRAARIQVLETQSGPATPNGTRDSRPSWEEVDRAMDQLEAEEHTPKSKRGKKKRSPLRRAQSGYDGVETDSPLG